jgi:hypothetical protein
MSESGVVPADATVAAGPRQVLHVVNSLVKVLPIDAGRGVPDPPGAYGAGGYVGGEAVVVTLPDFFGLVASNCDGGYITPSAAFDKQVKRFVITAVCGGDANQILLAVSQTPDALGGWWLYSFPGYSTYDTAMACFNGETHLTPTSIHTQVGYNRDGVYISFVQNCPLCEVSQATGAVLYALPKWAVYSGTTQAVVGPVYTGEVAVHSAWHVIANRQSTLHGALRQSCAAAAPLRVAWSYAASALPMSSLSPVITSLQPCHTVGPPRHWLLMQSNT